MRQWTKVKVPTLIQLTLWERGNINMYSVKGDECTRCPICASATQGSKCSLVQEGKFFFKNKWNNFLYYLRLAYWPKKENNLHWGDNLCENTRDSFPFTYLFATWGTFRCCISGKFRSFTVSWKNNVLFTCGFLDLLIIILRVTCWVCLWVNNCTNNPLYFMFIIVKASQN